MVSRLKHDNVVELLGYCVDGNTRILAYEFATMGSLHDMLHGMTLYVRIRREAETLDVLDSPKWGIYST